MNATISPNFGTVNHNGKIITLTDSATLTNRVFTGWFGDASDGENYTAEYKAGGIDSNGDFVEVYWQFGEVKGQETEDEGSYPWDNEHITQVVVQ